MTTKSSFFQKEWKKQSASSCSIPNKPWRVTAPKETKQASLLPEENHKIWSTWDAINKNSHLVGFPIGLRHDPRLRKPPFTSAQTSPASPAARYQGIFDQLRFRLKRNPIKSTKPHCSSTQTLELNGNDNERERGKDASDYIYIPPSW